MSVLFLGNVLGERLAGAEVKREGGGPGEILGAEAGTGHWIVILPKA